MKASILAIVFLVYSGSSIVESDRRATWAVKVESENFDNLFKVSDQLYRSEQPSTAGMLELEELGIKTVINLRAGHKDKKYIKHTALTSIEYPIHTKKINEEDLFWVLSAIKQAEKPVLIHCWHGSDRTGGSVAAYRIIDMNWTKKEAINEFRNGGFGYHEDWFPNILELLELLDVAQLKKKLSLDA
jgi:tyrosine-protein phosphatase SIW14